MEYESGFPDPRPWEEEQRVRNLKLPKLKIGRFLRKTVAPLIPGGSAVAEKVNAVIKSVKGQKPQGPGEVVPATLEAVEKLNKEERTKKILLWGAVGLGALLLIFLLVRRR